MESTHKVYATEFFLRSRYSTTRQDIPRFCLIRGFTATLRTTRHWSIPINISALLFLNILNIILPSSGLTASNRRLGKKKLHNEKTVPSPNIVGVMIRSVVWWIWQMGHVTGTGVRDVYRVLIGKPKVLGEDGKAWTGFL